MRSRPVRFFELQRITTGTLAEPLQALANVPLSQEALLQPALAGEVDEGDAHQQGHDALTGEHEHGEPGHHQNDPHGVSSQPPYKREDGMARLRHGRLAWADEVVDRQPGNKPGERRQRRQEHDRRDQPHDDPHVAEGEDVGDPVHAPRLSTPAASRGTQLFSSRRWASSSPIDSAAARLSMGET